MTERGQYAKERAEADRARSRRRVELEGPNPEEDGRAVGAWPLPYLDGAVGRAYPPGRQGGSGVTSLAIDIDENMTPEERRNVFDVATEREP
jgi:hypothetical protein